MRPCGSTSFSTRTRAAAATMRRIPTIPHTVSVFTDTRNSTESETWLLEAEITEA